MGLLQTITQSKWYSRKLAVAVITIAVILFNNWFQLGLSDAAMNKIVDVAMTFIGAQGVVDLAGAIKRMKGA